MDNQHTTPNRALQAPQALESPPPATADLKEPYHTPHLTSYGRFRHIAGATTTTTGTDIDCNDPVNFDDPRCSTT